MSLRQSLSFIFTINVLLLSLSQISEAKESNRVHFGDVTIAPNETVNEVVVLFGDLTIEGKVEDNAVVVFGDLELKQNASIKEDAVVVGGHLKLLAPEQVGGDKVQVSLTGSQSGDFWNGIFKIAILGAIFKYLGILASKLFFLITSILLAFIFAKNLMTMGSTISTAPWKCGLVGLLLWFCLPPVTVLLILSIVGLLLIPLLVPLVFLTVIFSHAAMAALIGQQIKMKNVSPAMQITLGAFIIFLLSLIPFANIFIFTLTVIIGAGAILFSKFGTTTPKFSK